MSKPKARNSAFLLHTGGALFTGLLLTASLVSRLLSPADLFVHTHYIVVGLLQYALAALVFYGFSLILLRLVPLPPFWGAAYAVVSCVFFLWAFFPAQPTSGMMRRIASSMEDYLAAQRLGQRLHLVAIATFALVQIGYLSYVARQSRASSTRASA